MANGHQLGNACFGLLGQQVKRFVRSLARSPFGVTSPGQRRPRRLSLGGALRTLGYEIALAMFLLLCPVWWLLLFRSVDPLAPDVKDYGWSCSPYPSWEQRPDQPEEGDEDPDDEHHPMPLPERQDSEDDEQDQIDGGPQGDESAARHVRYDPHGVLPEGHRMRTARSRAALGVSDAGRVMVRSMGKDFGFFGGELLLGEDALVLEGGQLLELLDVVGGGPGAATGSSGGASASGAPA